MLSPRNWIGMSSSCAMSPARVPGASRRRVRLRVSSASRCRSSCGVRCVMSRIIHVVDGSSASLVEVSANPTGTSVPSRRRAVEESGCEISAWAFAALRRSLPVAGPSMSGRTHRADAEHRRRRLAEPAKRPVGARDRIRGGQAGEDGAQLRRRPGRSRSSRWAGEREPHDPATLHLVARDGSSSAMAGENRGWIIRGNSAKTMPFMAAPRTGAASTGSRRPAPHPWPCSDGRTRRHRVRDRHHPDAATRHGRGGGVDLRQEVMSPFTP